MHIQDGLLPTSTWAAGWVGATALTALSLPRLQATSPPRVAMVTSAFFVASLLSFPVAGTSVHLSLLGLCGVVLGRAAFAAVLVGVTLQYFLFGHGGLLTIGVNAATMGSGALLAAGIYRLGRGPSVLRAGVAAFAGTLAALLLYGAAMLTAGSALRAVVTAVFVIHAPLLAVETVLTVVAVRFLIRVQPALVSDPWSAPAASDGTDTAALGTSDATTAAPATADATTSASGPAATPAPEEASP